MNIVEIRDQEAVVSHRKIAELTGNQQKNIVGLIVAHQKDFGEFGEVAFKTEALEGSVTGQSIKTYYLNEQQATLLMTYLRNTPVVRMFKKALVREFFELRSGVSAKYTHPRLPSHATVKTLITELGKTVAIVFIAKHMGISKEETQELAIHYDKVMQEATLLPRPTTPVDYDIEEFCASRIRVGNFGFLEVAKIYAEYKIFCVQNDVTPKSIVNFGKQFRDYIKLDSKVAKIKGASTRGYEGIAIAAITIDA